MTDRIERSDAILISAGTWFCPRCDFYRHFETEKGALIGAGKHLLAEHRVRLVLVPASSVPKETLRELIASQRKDMLS